MTPKQKAKEVVDKYLCIEDGYDTDLFCDECGMSKKAAQLCALVAVDEILYLLINVYEFDEFDNGKVEYWKEVKKEIEKL